MTVLQVHLLHATQPVQSPHPTFSSTELLNSRPIFPSPDHPGPGTRQFRTVPTLQSRLKWWKPAKCKPPHPDSPVSTHRKHNKGSCPHFPPCSLCPQTDSGTSPFGPAWCGMPPPLENCNKLPFHWKASPDLLGSPHLNDNETGTRIVLWSKPQKIYSALLEKKWTLRNWQHELNNELEHLMHYKETEWDNISWVQMCGLCGWGTVISLHSNMIEHRSEKRGMLRTVQWQQGHPIWAPLWWSLGLAVDSLYRIPAPPTPKVLWSTKPKLKNANGHHEVYGALLNVFDWLHSGL